MLTATQINFLREELKTAKNPLFIHDGDADGLCAFLLLYRIHREGRGYALTASSKLDVRGVRIVDELNPDKIFVLDIPIVEQEFIDKVNRPIFWIDHHMPLERKNIHYFNPRIKDKEAYIPTTRMAWQITERKEDLWIATAGCLADYAMPDYIEEFIAKYPSYLPSKEDLPTIIFKRPIKALIKLFFFIQKGPGSEVRKSIKILTRVESPDEIFKQETPQGKFLWKRFSSINEKFEDLLRQAKKSATRSKLVLFYYTEQQWSFTANLANELSALYPGKVVLIARRKGDELKCSLRGKNILPMIEKSLSGLQGGGGGHPDACGAVVKESDWEEFLRRFKAEIKNA
jgi:single-stranded DNA-specific DHH superfamily exonuclease